MLLAKRPESRRFAVGRFCRPAVATVFHFCMTDLRLLKTKKPGGGRFGFAAVFQAARYLSRPVAATVFLALAGDNTQRVLCASGFLRARWSTEFSPSFSAWLLKIPGLTSTTHRTGASLRFLTPASTLILWAFTGPGRFEVTAITELASPVADCAAMIRCVE